MVNNLNFQIKYTVDALQNIVEQEMITYKVIIFQKKIFNVDYLLNKSSSRTSLGTFPLYIFCLTPYVVTKV